MTTKTVVRKRHTRKNGATKTEDKKISRRRSAQIHSAAARWRRIKMPTAKPRTRLLVEVIIHVVASRGAVAANMKTDLRSPSLVFAFLERAETNAQMRNNAGAAAAREMVAHLSTNAIFVAIIKGLWRARTKLTTPTTAEATSADMRNWSRRLGAQGRR